jgi:hypothetical protein
MYAHRRQGGEGTTAGRQKRWWRWTRLCNDNYDNNNKGPTNATEGRALRARQKGGTSIGACSKSKRQPGPSGTVPTYLLQKMEGNRILFPCTSYLKTHNIVMGQVEVGRNWLGQFLPHANFKENRQKVQLGNSLFCPEVSVHQPNQVKL